MSGNEIPQAGISRYRHSIKTGRKQHFRLPFYPSGITVEFVDPSADGGTCMFFSGAAIGSTLPIQIIHRDLPPANARILK